MHEQKWQIGLFFTVHILFVQAGVCDSSDNFTKVVRVLVVFHLCLCAFVLLTKCVFTRLNVCAFGNLLLPLVSEVFHSEPDEIPPASPAAIRRRIMQSSPQAKTHSYTGTGGFYSVCVCVCSQ